MSEFFRTTPPGLLTDDDAGFLGANWQAVSEPERPFYAAKLNEYQNFREHYPRPMTPNEQEGRRVERSRVSEIFNDFDKATQGDNLGVMQFADADETPRLKVELANRAFVHHMTGLDGDRLERDYELARDALAKKMFGGAGTADDGAFHGQAKSWLAAEGDKERVQRSLVEAGRKAAAWEGSGLADTVRPTLQSWQAETSGPGFGMDFTGEYERTFKASQAEARAEFDRLRPYVDAAWLTLSGGPEEAGDAKAVDFEALADRLMEIPQDDRRKVLAMVKTRASLLPAEKQAGFFKKAGKTFSRQFEAIPQGAVNELPRILGGLGALGGDARERQGLYEDIRNLQRLDIDPVTGRNWAENAGLAIAGSLPGLAAMWTISPWVMVGQFASDARQTMRVAMESQGVSGEYSSEVANGLAIPAGIAMGYLERITFGSANSVPGVKQLQAKLVAKLSETATKRALARGGVLGLEVVEQGVQEALQDTTPTLLLDAAQSLGAPIPEVQAWGPFMETIQDPANWAVALVFAGVGFGNVPNMEAAQILRERGASSEQIQQVIAAPDAETWRSAVLDAVTNPATAPAAPEMAAVEAGATIDQGDAGVASIVREASGWWVNHSDGRRTQVESPAAAQMLVSDLQQVNTQDEADAMVAMADDWAERQPKAKQTFTGEQVTAGPAGVFASRMGAAPRLVEMKAKSAEALGEELELLARAEGGDGAVTRLVNGSNSLEWRRKVSEDARTIVETLNTKQNVGGTVLTQLHERVEATWRAGIEEGTITMAETFRAVRRLEEAMGRQIFVSDDPSETEVREAVSEMVVADTLGRRRDGTRTPAGAISKGMTAAIEAAADPAERASLGKFRSFLRALRAHFRAVFKMAAAIGKARREGKIKEGDDYSTFVNKVLGLDSQVEHEAEVAREAVGELDASGETFSLSSAAGLERLANQIANRPSTPAEKARVWNRMAADLGGMARSVALNEDNNTLVRAAEIRKAAMVKRAELIEKYENEALANGAGEALSSSEMASITGNPFLNWLTHGTTGLGMRGRLISKSRALKTGQFSDSQGYGDFDNMPAMPPALLRGTQMPDQVARDAHADGLITEADVDLLWNRIGAELDSVETWRKRVRSAESAMMAARKRATSEAGAWREQELAALEANKAVNAERDSKRALVILDKMLASLPAEVRSKVGGFTRVAELKTNAARFEYFSRKVTEIDRVLEHHLREKYLTEVRDLLKASRPKMAAGEKDKGRLGVNAHAWLMEAERIMGLTPAQLEVEEDAVNLRQASAVLSDEVIAEYGRQYDYATDEAGAREALDQHAALLNLFGGLTHRRILGTDARGNTMTGPPIRSAGEIFAALEAAQEMETGGRLGWFKEIIQRRERRARQRETAIAEAGGLLDAENRKEALRQSDTTVGRWARDFANSHFSFEGFVSSIFGEDSRTHQWADAETLRADISYRDALRDREQVLGDFLRSMWPRSSARQRQRNLEKLATSRPVPNAPAGGRKRMSELDAIHYRMLWMDDDTASREWLESHGYGQAMQDAMEAMLSDEAKEVRRWLVGQYDAQYDQINAVYRRMYGVNLPRVKNYAPRLVDHGGVSSDMSMDPLQEGRQLMAGFTKRRRLDTKSPPRQVDALTAYWQNAHAVEYWTAWAENMGDMRAVFSHWSTQAAVKATNGEAAGVDLNEWLQILERNGVQNANGQGALRRWSQAMADSALVGKLGVLAKQMIAGYASASQIGIPEYLGAVGRFVRGEASATLAAVKAMPAIQRRMATTSPEVRTGTRGRGLTPIEAQLDGLLKRVGSDIYALDNAHIWLRERIGAMDALFTTLSAGAAYDVAFREATAAGLTAEDAGALATASMEKVVADSAQPDSVRNKSLSELRMGLIGRLLMPFQSANRQALGMTLLAVKQGRTADAVRMGVIHWMVTGIVAQTVGSVMRTIVSDDDVADIWEWEDYARAVVIGPLTGARYVGIAIESIAPLFGGFERRQASTPLGEGARLMRQAIQGDFDFKSLTDTLNGVGLLVGGRASWASISANVAKQLAGLGDTFSRTDAEADAEQAKRDKATLKAAAEANPKPEKSDEQKAAEKAKRRATEKADAQAVRDAGIAE